MFITKDFGYTYGVFKTSANLWSVFATLLHFKYPATQKNLNTDVLVQIKLFEQNINSFMKKKFKQEFGSRWMPIERKSIWTVRVIN